MYLARGLRFRFAEPEDQSLGPSKAWYPSYLGKFSVNNLPKRKELELSHQSASRWPSQWEDAKAQGEFSGFGGYPTRSIPGAAGASMPGPMWGVHSHTQPGTPREHWISSQQASLPPPHKRETVSVYQRCRNENCR